jgi:hypothetical protein
MSPSADRAAYWPVATETDVWLGDVIKAFRMLDVGAADARNVARLLGFDLLARDAGQLHGRTSSSGFVATPRGEASQSRLRSSEEPSVPSKVRPRLVPSSPPMSALSAERNTSSVPAVSYSHRLRQVGVDFGPGTRTERDGRGQVQLLARDPIASRSALPLLPLLNVRMAPSIVTASIATDAGDGPHDIDALVELIAHRRFDLPVPRALRASLFRGVQLLLDRSPPMAPFDRDVTELARIVRAVVGQDVSQVEFVDYPERTVPTGAPAYSLPPDGTPALILGDLGVGHAPGHVRADTNSAWRNLAESLRRHGSSVVALVPYPQGRWPALGDCIAMIQWDTTTTVADVTRAVGRVLGGPRGPR